MQGLVMIDEGSGDIIISWNAPRAQLARLMRRDGTA
jgi:hypothetical protein